MANSAAKAESVTLSNVLGALVLFMLLSALTAIEQGNIWNFLLCTGCALTILFGPKDSEFFQAKINKISDLTKAEYSADPVSIAFLSMAFLMMLTGLLGTLWFG
jgi:hypothetical protein